MKEGWTYKKLGDIATDMYRGAGIKRDQVVSEGIPCVRYGEIYTTYNIAFKECLSHTKESFVSSPKYFEHGDLLFAITGESVEDIGKTIAYLGHEKCLLGGDIVCMKHNQNPKYLSYALSSADAIRQKGLGKTKLKVVHTNIPALSEITIPLPGLSEQQRIVSRLDAAFAHIDELKANAEKQLSEARNLFQKALEKAMEPKEGWEERTLGQICDIKSVLVNPTESMYKDMFHIGGANIESNTGTLTDLKTASEEGLTSGKFTFDSNDVLYNKIRPYLVKVVRPNFSGLCSADMYPLTPKKGVSKDYLYYILISKDFTEYAILNSGRAGMPKVNRQALFSYRTKVPPISEQYRIAKRLDALSEHVHELEDVLRKTISECDALKQALLRKVFE